MRDADKILSFHGITDPIDQAQDVINHLCLTFDLCISIDGHMPRMETFGAMADVCIIAACEIEELYKIARKERAMA